MPAVILISTNGLLTDCPESIVVVKLSLEVFEETHDRLSGVKWEWKKVLESISALRELDRYRNLEPGVNTVFTRENQDEVIDFLDMIKRMPGIRSHTVSLVRGDAQEEIDIQKYRQVVKH